MTSCDMGKNGGTDNSISIESDISQSQGYDDTQNSQIIDDLESSFNTSEYLEVMDYLEQEVPELSNYAEYILNESDNKAHLMIQSFPELKEVYKDGMQGKYLGKYYFVYVGEEWEDHTVNWDWFYVSENLNDILWYCLPDDKVYTLSEWRKSSHYRQLNK